MSGAHETENDDAALAIGEDRNDQEKARTWHRRIKRARRRAAKRLVAWCGPLLLRWLSKTWRVSVLDTEHLEDGRGQGGGHFMALWHGRMLVGLPHHAFRDWYVLVSPSDDGDISEALLEGFRYRVIRGSSSRGGARALREMLDVLDSGAVLIITPDGPRGPMHSMNPGLAWMARATGYAIVPVGLASDRAWHAKSWDRFTLPKPGARVAIVYGAPIRVTRAATPEDLERATEQIRVELLRAEERGFAFLGRKPDW